jgi:hypothetical protein
MLQPLVVDEFVYEDILIEVSLDRNEEPDSLWFLKIFFLDKETNRLLSLHRKRLPNIQHPVMYWRIGKFFRYMQWNPKDFDWDETFRQVDEYLPSEWEGLMGEEVYKKIMSASVPEEILQEILYDPTTEKEDILWMLENHLVEWREEFFEKYLIMGPPQFEYLKKFDDYLSTYYESFPFERERIEINLFDHRARKAYEKGGVPAAFLSTLILSAFDVEEIIDRTEEIYPIVLNDLEAVGAYWKPNFARIYPRYSRWVAEQIFPKLYQLPQCLVLELKIIILQRKLFPRLI